MIAPVIAHPWREALQELSRRKLRTLLTLLGLIFGIGAIVAMLAVGEGSRREALKLVEGLGLRNVIARTKPQDTETLKEVRLKSLGLTLADAAAARAVVPGADAYAGEKEIKTHAVFSEFAGSDAQASGVSPAFFELSALELAEGRALTDADDASLASVCVLGHQAARSLFPQGSAVGQLVKVNHVWLEVVGVLADRDLAKDQFEGVKLGLESNRVYLPLASARTRFRFQPLEDEIDRFMLRVDDPAGIAGSARVLAAVLEQRHAGIEDYALVVPAQLFRQHQQTQRIFRIVMAAIAGVSLLVGGIGIMNIIAGERAGAAARGRPAACAGRAAARHHRALPARDGGDLRAGRAAGPGVRRRARLSDRDAGEMAGGLGTAAGAARHRPVCGSRSRLRRLPGAPGRAARSHRGIAHGVIVPQSTARPLPAPTAPSQLR